MYIVEKVLRFLFYLSVAASLVALGVYLLEEAPDQDKLVREVYRTEANGAIMAGPRLSVDSLSTRTSQLPHIELDAPAKVIGRNTIQCMQSGAIYGHAAMIDGLIDRVQVELCEPLATVVATGGLSPQIIPVCRHKIVLDENLMLHGLRIIYDKNKRP